MIYLCLGGTWVPAVTERDLFGLVLRLPKVGLKFCVVPVSDWYLGFYLC